MRPTCPNTPNLKNTLGETKCPYTSNLYTNQFEMFLGHYLKTIPGIRTWVLNSCFVSYLAIDFAPVTNYCLTDFIMCSKCFPKMISNISKLKQFIAFSFKSKKSHFLYCHFVVLHFSRHKGIFLEN